MELRPPLGSIRAMNLFRLDIKDGEVHTHFLFKSFSAWLK